MTFFILTKRMVTINKLYFLYFRFWFLPHFCWRKLPTHKGADMLLITDLTKDKLSYWIQVTTYHHGREYQLVPWRHLQVGFSYLVGHAHPTIYNFLSAVHLEQASSERKISSFRRGVLREGASLNLILSTYHTYENNVVAYLDILAEL